MSSVKRASIFATRHFNRSITIYTQRPQSVHVNLRANCNKFYKCEKFEASILPPSLNRVKLQVTEFQHCTSDSVPDESFILDKEGKETGEYKNAINQFSYFGDMEHFKRFDSKYMRRGIPSSQPNHTTFTEKELKEIWFDICKRRSDNIKR